MNDRKNLLKTYEIATTLRLMSPNHGVTRESGPVLGPLWKSLGRKTNRNERMESLYSGFVILLVFRILVCHGE